MSTKDEKVEIGILKDQMVRVQKDITDIRTDVKTMLATLDGNFVTKAEFGEYKKSQVWQKLLIAIGFTIIGALVTYFFSTIGK